MLQKILSKVVFWDFAIRYKQYHPRYDNHLSGANIMTLQDVITAKAARLSLRKSLDVPNMSLSTALLNYSI